MRLGASPTLPSLHSSAKRTTTLTGQSTLRTPTMPRSVCCVFRVCHVLLLIVLCAVQEERKSEDAFCFRCAEDHSDDEGNRVAGTNVLVVHACCGICGDCEHAVDCPAEVSVLCVSCAVAHCAVCCAV